jgi:hypothetical protein
MFACTAGLFAQTIVSTTPSNKNAIIEDLTGIHCGYCPDGALKADQLRAAAPGRVVIIGNHAGGYATPSGSDKDFRTPEGTTIDQLSKPTGYPAGNVNRRITGLNTNGGTAFTRGSWATYVSQIMDEPSPLNLAVEAYYYAGTNKIIIKVEGYYTSSSTGDDFLTVAVLQDNILGYQSDYGPYYPSRIDPGTGLYRHMDVLRKYLTTPTLGEKVTAKGKDEMFTWTKEYTPTQIGPNVVPVIEDMKIVAFMTEDPGLSEVITAVETDVMERPTGINEASSLKGLNIYPNPFEVSTTINFDLDKDQMITINFYDVTGKVVQSVPSTVYTNGNHMVTFDGSSLEGGLYYVNIIAEDGIITRKIVLNK